MRAGVWLATPIERGGFGRAAVARPRGCWPVRFRIPGVKGETRQDDKHGRCAPGLEMGDEIEGLEID